MLSYKPKKKTNKKKDSEGFVKAGCHTSKEKAHGQRAAIEGGPINAGHDKDQDTVLEWLLETIEELDEKQEVKSTKKYDDNKNLKGKQSELPDHLQKGIIKKADPNDPDLDEGDDTPHLRQYGAPQGSKRDKQLDQTKKDLASGDPERVARAYRRRERMEKQARERDEREGGCDRDDREDQRKNADKERKGQSNAYVDDSGGIQGFHTDCWSSYLSSTQISRRGNEGVSWRTDVWVCGVHT